MQVCVGPCPDVRERLATLSGRELRRARLRRHVRGCPGCREFAAEVKRQRKAMAVLLPVVPTAGLKAGLMSGLAAKAGAAGAGVGGGAGGGLGAVLANAGAAKLAVAGVLAVGGIGGTVAAVNAVDGSSSGDRAPAPAEHRGPGGAATRSGLAPARGEPALGPAGRRRAHGPDAQRQHGRSKATPGLTRAAPGQLKSGIGSGGQTSSSHSRAGARPGRFYSRPRRSGPTRGQIGSPSTPRKLTNLSPAAAF
jgi:hypothetical protein